MSSSKRHFTVIMENKEHGLYVSSTPSSAARKAVTKLCTDNKKKKVEFSLRETTQDSNKKIYGPYLGEMQKLDKPIELEGRVIRYKPIVKRNNQVGGTFNVGEHVKTLNKLMINNLKGKENRYVVLKVFSRLGTILIRHIDDNQGICLSVDKVAKIDSNGAYAASAASAAISNQESKIWEDLSRHVSKNDDDDDDWFIIRYPQGEYIKVKRNGNKNSYVIINKNSESSNENFENIDGNSDWEVLSNASNHRAPNVSNNKVPNVKNTSTFVVNISRTFGGNILYICPICKADEMKHYYNQSKKFPHKEGCINIGKIPIESSKSN